MPLYMTEVCARRFAHQVYAAHEAGEMDLPTAIAKVDAVMHCLSREAAGEYSNWKASKGATI